MRPFAVSVLACAALVWGAVTYASAQGEARGRSAVVAEIDDGGPMLLAQADVEPGPGPAAAVLVDAGVDRAAVPAAGASSAPPAPPAVPVAASDPASDPGGAIDLVVSLARRGYLAAVAHLLLFWAGLLALARSGWLVARAPWLARGRVLVFVSGLVANLTITLPAAVAGTATWRGIAFAVFGGVLLWLQPVVTRLAGASPAPATTAT